MHEIAIIPILQLPKCYGAEPCIIAPDKINYVKNIACTPGYLRKRQASP